MNNKKHMSKMGYRDDSPYNQLPFIDIHTNNGIIDMSATGQPLMANGRYLPPYSGQHQFNTNVVRETPVLQRGGKKQHGLKMVDDTAEEILRNDIYRTYKPSQDVHLSQNPFLYEKSFYNAILNNKKGLPNDYVNTMNDDYGYNINQAIFDASLQTGSYKKPFNYNPLEIKKMNTFNNTGLTYKKGGYINKQGMYVHKDGIHTSKPGLWSNTYMSKHQDGGSYHPLTNPNGIKPKINIEQLFAKPEPQKPYEPSQMVNDAKAFLSSLDVSSSFGNNPFSKTINAGARLINSVGDAYTSARYFADGQYSDGATDLGESLLDLVPLRTGKGGFDLGKNGKINIVGAKLNKFDKSINNIVKGAKVAAVGDDFIHSTPGKILFGDPNSKLQYQTGGYTPRLVETVPNGYIPVNGVANTYHNPQSSISQNNSQGNGTQASNADWNAYLQTPAGIKWKQNQQLKTQTDDYVYTQPQIPVVTPNVRNDFAARAGENDRFFDANGHIAGRTMYPIRKTNNVTKSGNGIYFDSDVYYQPMNGLGQDIGEGKVIANADFNNRIGTRQAMPTKDFNDYKYPVKSIDATVKAYKEGGGIPDRYKALGFNSVNTPHKTPGAAKSHAVVIKENGNYELIRFGQQGVSGSPKKDGESKAYKERREAFKARHAANIAKGKSSAAYWANKTKWQDGGEIPFNIEELKRGGYINKAGRYVHEDGVTTSKPGLWSNVYMKNKKELGGVIVPKFQLGNNDFKPVGSTILPGSNTTTDKAMCPPGFAFVGGACVPLQSAPEANVIGTSGILPKAKTDYVTEQYKTDSAFAKRYDDSIENYTNAQANKNRYNPLQDIKMGILGANAVAGIAGTMYDNNYRLRNARKIQADSEYNPSFSYGANDYGVAKKGGFLQHLADGGDVNGSEFDAYDFLFNEEDDKIADDARTTTEDIAAATKKAEEYAVIAKENEQLKADAQEYEDNSLAMGIANEESYYSKNRQAYMNSGEDTQDFSATTDNTTNIGGSAASGSNKGFNTYASPEAGWNALHHQLDLYKTGRTKNNVNGNSSLYHAMSVYAPASDNNRPKQYAEFIAKNMGISPNTPISQIDVKEWAKSIAKMEGNKTGNNPGNIRPFKSGGEYDVSDMELQDLIRRGIQFQMM